MLWKGNVPKKLVISRDRELSEIDKTLVSNDHTLSTLVWEQRTGPRTNINLSTNTGSEDAATNASFSEKVSRGCLSLNELGLVMNVRPDGTQHTASCLWMLFGMRFS